MYSNITCNTESWVLPWDEATPTNFQCCTCTCTLNMQHWKVGVARGQGWVVHTYSCCTVSHITCYTCNWMLFCDQLGLYMHMYMYIVHSSLQVNAIEQICVPLWTSATLVHVHVSQTPELGWLPRAIWRCTSSDHYFLLVHVHVHVAYIHE